jgi:hypothetical protein
MSAVLSQEDARWVRETMATFSAAMRQADKLERDREFIEMLCPHLAGMAFHLADVAIHPRADGFPGVAAAEYLRILERN